MAAKRIINRLTCVTCMSCAWLAPLIIVASAAYAQAAPAPTTTKSAPAVMGYLVAFVLVAAVIAVSLMPSKRSHQD